MNYTVNKLAVQYYLFLFWRYVVIYSIAIVVLSAPLMMGYSFLVSADSVSVSITPEDVNTSTSINPSLSFVPANALNNGSTIALDREGSYSGVTCSNITVTKTSDANFTSASCEDGFSLWARGYGGSSGTDNGSGMVATSDGGVIFVGNTDSYGAGSYDLYVVKTDADGDVSWSKALGGTSSEYGEDVIETSDGGYLVTGYTYSYGAGDSDYYIVKLTSTGSVSWEAVLGGGNQEKAFEAVEVSDGYVVTGYTETYGSGSRDAYILKVDNSGSLSWSNVIGGTGIDVTQTIVATDDGGFIAAGYTNSYGAGNQDIYILKLTSSGSLSWSRAIGGTGNDLALGAIKDSNGDIVLAGHTTSYGAGNQDMYIVKINSSGSILWSRAIGDTSYDYARDIIQTADGGYFIGGDTASFGDGYQVYASKLTSSGSLSWSVTAGSTNSEVGFTVDQMIDGGLILSGYTDDLGPGFNDIFAIKMSSLGEMPNYDDFSSVTSAVASPSSGTATPSPTETSPSESTATPTSSVASPTSEVTSPYTKAEYNTVLTLTTSGALDTTNDFEFSWSGVVTPSTPGNYMWNVSTSANDIGATTQYIGSENEVGIDASVDSVIAFAIMDSTLSQEVNACDLGTLSTLSVSECSYRLKVSSNTSGGYQVQVLAQSGLTYSGEEINPVTDGSVTAGVEEYGILLDPGDASNGSISPGGGFPAATDSSLPTSSQILYSSDGPNSPDYQTPVVDFTALVTHRAAISAETPPGAYTQTVSYYVTPIF